MSLQGIAQSAPTLPKAPTGIQGFDEITGGGLPRGRPSLVCGGPGCGKTLFALQFLVHGAEQDEPGVFMAFEETAPELAQNARSLGFDLDDLMAQGKLALDHVHVERSEIEETGEYDLEGLFIRLGYAIDTIGAKRVVLDTLESLFGSLGDEAVLRAELRRLFHWLKDREVTAVITAERGAGALTRQGLEEYVSDCVVLLDHRVSEQIATRRVRVVKYRGSAHGTNEFPFLIDEKGLSVLPITSVGLTYDVSSERVSSGVPGLDAMLGGEGYFRGSSILVSGRAGTGKTSFAGAFAEAACRRGERSLYFTFEESPRQLARNLHSIGVDLAPWMSQGLLRVQAARPSVHGLEMHLARMYREIREHEPRAVIIDPAASFLSVAAAAEVQALLVRLLDFLKERQVTTLLTHLASGSALAEETSAGISSIVDTWLVLRELESAGERNRGIFVVKSRGMAHSNQVRPFLLSSRGIELDGARSELAREAAR
ncbi:MAG TPA: circadian clock protein KaiC [Solirubrobacterales bacterium]|nr:circadian clock protein KaiC [Solirubrobacterales bacterium]